jgi:transposase InsO family protein
MHTDLGTQYTSIEAEKYLRDKPIIQSFSNKGNSYDNACIESFHAILKKKEIYLNTYQSFVHARLILFQFIEGWYYRNRVHSSINYMTPIEYESLFHSIAC